MSFVSLEQKPRPFHTPLFFPIGLLGIVLFSACAPSVDNLKKQLSHGDYGAAVKSVSDDSKMQLELAALMLEQEAISLERTAELIQNLASAKAPGTRALKRLEKSRECVAARLAKIALRRGRRPKKDDLYAWLQDDSSDVRAAAVKNWYSIIEQPTLEKLLLDIDPRVRRSAIKGLTATFPTKKVSEALREALRVDPSPMVRAEAARAGSALGPEVLLVLKTALRDKSLGVRLAAIFGLAETGDTDCLILVRNLARGPLDEIAIAAAAELSRLGESRGVDTLRRALEWDDPQTRITALLRLERANFKERDKVTLKLLKDKSPEVVLQAAALLFYSKPAKAEVIKALKDLENDDINGSKEANYLLVGLGDPKATARVKEELLKAPLDAASILGKLRRAPMLSDTFLLLMGDEHREIRIAAAQALLRSQ